MLLYNRTVIRFDTVKCNENLKVDAHRKVITR